MKTTNIIKKIWACQLVGVLLLKEVPVSLPLSLPNAHLIKLKPRGDLASTSLPGFSSPAQSRYGNLYNSAANSRIDRHALLCSKRARKLSVMKSTATSRDETKSLPSEDTVNNDKDREAEEGASSSIITSNGESNMSKSDTGSTAIILNMNARSVTPQLISIASNIVGESNVYITKSMEDATLAARTVVRGCTHHHTTDGDSSSSTGESNNNDDDIDGKTLQKYSLVVPVGGDGTLSGWINTMVDEILLFDKLEHVAEGNHEGELTKSNGTSTMSVEEALQQLPLVGYIPMGTGNGLGYVIGCKSSSNDKGPKKSLLSRLNVLTLMQRRRVESARQVMTRLKEVGDAVQQAERLEQLDISNAVSGKCSVVEMPLMEVTHPDIESNTVEEKGDLCFFAGAGFDSLMLHDFQQIKAWSKSTKSAPAFVKDALSSVAGYCVALVTKTLPQTLKYGTHRIHVEVTTQDEDTLWVDHRRGDFSELAVGPNKLDVQNGKQQLNGSGSKNSTKSSSQHLIYSGTTGIIAAATTPYYGGGMKLFPYARLIPDKLQLRLGRISPLTGFVNIPKIFEGSYREKGERSFGCLDFIGKDFEVEVTSGRYEEYMKRQCREEKEKKKRKSLSWLEWLGPKGKVSTTDGQEQECEDCDEQVKKGFPFQHSGESMGVKERFRLRVVQEPVKFVSFLEPRVVVTD